MNSSNIMATTVVERQYHTTSSAYVLPNECVDPQRVNSEPKLTLPPSALEHDRLDAQAAAIVEMIGGTPFLAYKKHITTAKKAADVGCGTGVATIQLAHLLPEAQVYGLDLTPVPDPSRAIAPANANWVSGNILDIDLSKHDDHMSAESLAPGTVDYMFGRMLFLGISDWRQYFQIAAKALREGAILEHQDLDWNFYSTGTDECLSDSWPWHARVMEAVEFAGLSKIAGSNAALLAEAAGLNVLSTQRFEFSFVPSIKAPCSQTMGRYVQAKLIPNYPEILRKLLTPIGVTPDELKQLTADCLRDLASEEGIHQKYTVTLAQKCH